VKCPDCAKPLSVKKETNVFYFHCQFCGFNKKIRSVNETSAYQLLVENVGQSRRERFSRSKEGKKEEKDELPFLRKTLQEKNQLVLSGGYKPDQLPVVVKQIINNPDVELVYYKFLKQQFPKLAEEMIDLPSSLHDFLNQKGIKQVFSFQLEAFKRVKQGKNVVIVAPTGTGKTESFLFPILAEIWGIHPNPLLRRGPFAIFIYPTKALARDQRKKIDEYGKKINVDCEVFDGDTATDVREKIYNHPPDILITNPDMLHYHMQKIEFRSLIQNVKFVVIDEVHVAVGAFGSNLHYILKRLNRLTKNNIQFIAASATIGNAVDFVSQLFDLQVEGIEVKHARKAPTHLLILYPYGVSQYTVSGEITKALTSSGHKTLVFQNSHKNAEITNLLLKRMRVRTAVHRAGLPKNYRYAVEKEFREGELDALVSTPTLELGIDIGDVDAVVSSIVDFTRFTQRLGRAGRKGQESIATLVLRNNDPISTFYTCYPEIYFEDMRQGYVEPNNEIVSYYQLLAAAIDKPIKEDEFITHKNVLSKLVQDGLLRKTQANSYRIVNRQQAYKKLQSYNLRGIGDNVIIQNQENKVLGERSMPMAARELHPGAIYLLGGKYYRSISFDYNKKLELGKVTVKEIEPINKKTTALRFAFPEILAVLEKKTILGTEAVYCDLKITETVVGYIESNIFTNDNFDLKDLEEPIEYSYTTKGFMFTMPTPIDLLLKYKQVKEEELIAGTFHAVEHVLIESSGMLTGGGSTEIGGISMGTSGAIFVYDGAKGGSGLSKLLFNRLDEAFSRSLKILESCSCQTIDGCPRCTYSYQCGNNNSPLNKLGAMESLKILKDSKLEIIENYAEYEPLV